MNMSNDSHIIYFQTLGTGVKPSVLADTFIGVLLVIAVLIGILGNMSAGIYFWKKLRHTLPDLLYTIIVITDFCTSTVTIATIPSLLNKRLPVLFKSFHLCAAWGVLFNHLQRFSMFMVMVISATRTIAIFRPFYEIKRMGVIVVCVVFELFWILLDAIILGTGSLKMVYYAPAAVCGMIPVKGAPIWIWNFLVYITMLWLVLGSLVVFVSFILSLRTISARKRFAAQNVNERKFWEVSITITLFTAVFLLYNLPLLVLQTWANVIYLTGTTDYDAQNEAYSWYGLLISHLFLTSFNAASNPTFYFFRMRKYRNWLLGKVIPIKWRKASARVADSSGHANLGFQVSAIGTTTRTLDTGQ